jgi:transcriptional regulator with XRE-family HTH domain
LCLKQILNNRSTKLSLGTRLAGLRKEKGLSQDELGEKIERDGRQISRWENDKITPTIEILEKIARFFNISLDYLVFEEIPKVQLKFKNHKLITTFEALEELPEEDKKALLILIESVLAKNRLKKIISSM